MGIGSNKTNVNTGLVGVRVALWKQYSNAVTQPGNRAWSSAVQLYMKRVLIGVISGGPVPCSVTLG